MEIKSSVIIFCLYYDERTKAYMYVVNLPRTLPWVQIVQQHLFFVYRD